MMVFAGVEALIIVLLIGALLVGQPAAVSALEARLAAQTVELARYKATAAALPQPVIKGGQVCTPRVTC